MPSLAQQHAPAVAKLRREGLSKRQIMQELSVSSGTYDRARRLGEVEPPSADYRQRFETFISEMRSVVQKEPHRLTRDHVEGVLFQLEQASAAALKTIEHVQRRKAQELARRPALVRAAIERLGKELVRVKAKLRAVEQADENALGDMSPVQVRRQANNLREQVNNIERQVEWKERELKRAEAEAAA